MAEQENPVPEPAEQRPDAAEEGPNAVEEEVVPVEEEAHDVESDGTEELSAEDLAILDDAQQDLVAEMREDMLRARAELVNFRNRVERDRQLNREATITEVLRALLPALDDLDRAETHGELVEGTPMALIAAKLRGAFERFGLSRFGEVGEPFDPSRHEALFQQPTPGADSETVLDVIDFGYRFGDRVVRPAKVAVAVPVRE